MKIYENKILRILGFIFIWIYVFGVGICFAAKWYAIGISGAILLVVWLNSGLIGDTIYKYRVKQATKQIKRSNFGMVSVAIYSLTFIIVNKSCPLQYTP